MGLPQTRVASHGPEWGGTAISPAITLAQRMLTDYGDTLPERDKGLLDLSIRMHQDRLKEVPRQTEEALARKQLQDQRREEWIRNGKKVP